MSASPSTNVQQIPEATILFAGDSGDGMQLTGSQFTLASAYAHNDLATLPDYPAEIRAPAGTTYGVSGFQLHFGEVDIHTPGDEVDLLVAMNAAALKVHLHRVRPGGTVVLNVDKMTDRDLELAGLDSNPLEDGTLDGYQVLEVQLTKLTHEALDSFDLSKKQKDRSKNMFALGLALWMYSRPIEPAENWIKKKFEDKPEIRDANLHVLHKGAHYGETVEAFAVRYEVNAAAMRSGTYRAIRGAEALALGLVAAADKSGLPLFYGSYPITPASDILHEVSKHKNFGVMTFQAEDEISAVGAAVGSSFSGGIGVCATSGPGLALKTETIGLAVMTELPLVVIDMQRGGPSTGLPTKPEQSDLLQAIYGRNGDAPLPVIAATSPGDCFYAAYEACRIATKYMTPVILLADGYLGNGSEAWRIPDTDKLKPFDVSFETKKRAKTFHEDDDGNPQFLPYVRDEETLARVWAKPGTPDLEHRLGGLEKQDKTGDVSYDAANHQKMTQLRAEKVKRVRQDIPPTQVHGDPDADLLVLGWGSTKGAIEEAVERAVEDGLPVARAQLRHVWPLPGDLGDLLDRYDQVLVPELNNGQLSRLLRDEYLKDVRPLNKVQGRPFRAEEILEEVRRLLGHATPA
ncbi:2-oxoglutarate ferredoxin oxidoreductase subunit alpha [Longibacter salinarum]|uniref:2-oxoglutarate ferredoxin oxidoreductase subunit alpha n=1 Tax=Longibacter salinarum TaxID=1850348 RepID=A0A2A8D0H1_9BACT|nr:2-oxoacid:acceptor oxidoreductase subunit alpha [Longibacter salinarum]PEN14469.1 2-oxoglutarate ferredoxin oxidoreductase subunit alpha [Longibacter salinarum]